jgi:hypothetical protein
MGNQQLIILVIGVVIVGIATVVGIDAFEDNRVKANADAIAQDLAKMGADAQAWKQKPTPFGGQGENSCATSPCADNDFEGLSDLSTLGYNTASGSFENLNGFYQITSNGGAGPVTISGCNGKTGVAMDLVVSGITSDDFTSTVTMSGPGTAKTCTPGGTTTTQ